MRFLILIFLTFSTIFANSLELDGIVESQNEKIISSKMMGYITKIYVNEGDSVKKGEILYEIDPTDILYNSDILKNQVKNLELNLKRYKDLLDQDLVSKFDYEQLELNLMNTKNMISITNAKLKEVDTQYDYLKIKAPNDGLIIKKSIKAGEMAMPSIPALILTDLSNLLIKADISETNLILGEYSVVIKDTATFPAGDYLVDVEYTSADGFKRSTPTFQIKMVERL